MKKKHEKTQDHKITKNRAKVKIHMARAHIKRNNKEEAKRKYSKNAKM